MNTCAAALIHHVLNHTAFKQRKQQEEAERLATEAKAKEEKEEKEQLDAMPMDEEALKLKQEQEESKRLAKQAKTKGRISGDPGVEKGFRCLTIYLTSARSGFMKLSSC